jgi:FAD/FMN-containing dehydrogenase
VVLTPANRFELSRSLADASACGARVEAVHLNNIASLVEHQPEDMTATVEAGMILSTVQDLFRRAGQWLPIDPPESQVTTVGDLLAYNLFGPRRYGYGTIRDYLIGIKVALANGEIIKAGGKVVKNVAGYDLCKLFVGARHTLGIIVEATFKLRPLPEKEIVLESCFESIRSLSVAARSLLDSACEPVICDAHNRQRTTLVTGFAGPVEDVDYQVQLAQQFAQWTECSTAYDRPFPAKISVMPSTTPNELQRLSGQYVARFGNGVIHHEGSKSSRALPCPELSARVKKAYDPSGIFPDYSL